jgi:DnaJ-class molecular chaperone
MTPLTLGEYVLRKRGQKVSLHDNETHCPSCSGTGMNPSVKIEDSIFCLRCKGKGKLNWVEILFV